MKNFGNGVSRILDSTNRSYKGVIFQADKPPLDSEWNLVQDLINSQLQGLIGSTTSSGFVQLGALAGRPLGDLRDLWANTIKIVNPYCIINGEFLFVGGGTNQFQPSTTSTIWTLLSGLDTETLLIMPPVPATLSRDDLIFLEVWEELITPTSNIKKFGNSQYGGTDYTNDLIDPNIKQETSLRTQLKYRYRVATGIDFISFREGIDDPSVFAQGAVSAPTTYTYTKTAKGHYVAGLGDASSITALGTVDGYVYALPIAAVHRKNSQPFNTLTNPNGSATKIDAVTSDRLDGAFQDDISASDIEDLRHLIASDQDSLQILQASLDEIVDGVPNRLVLGDSPHIFSNVNLQSDGISTTIRSGNGDSLLRRPNGYQRTFADNEITQRTAYYDAAPALPGGVYVLTPPIFYTALQTTEYQSYNPFVGGVTVPVLTSILTGLPISGDPSVGMKGWQNLGDRLNKLPATFTPATPSDVTGATAIVANYDLVIPHGTGFSQVPLNVFKISDDVNNVTVKFTQNNVPVSTTLTRTINGYVDSQIIRNVSSFIAPDSTYHQDYRPGVVERIYHVAGGGISTIDIPATVDGDAVRSVFRVQNALTLADIPLGVSGNNKVKLNPDGTFRIQFTSFFPQPTDTIRVTLLMGGVTCDAIVRNRGIGNFLKVQDLILTTDGTSSYKVRASSDTNKIEYIYGVAGLQETSTLSHIAYLGPSPSAIAPLVSIQSVTGLGTDTVTFNFSSGLTAGQTLTIPVIGTYAPLVTDKYTVTYNYVPYQGLSNLLTDNEQMQAQVVSLAEKALVSTNGTGGGAITNTVASSVYFPINATDADYNFENGNVLSPRDQANSTLKALDYFYDAQPLTSFIRVGDSLTLTKQAQGMPKYATRGCSLDNPLISYRVENLTYPVTENLSSQSDGVNRTYRLKFPVLNVWDTYALTTNFPLAGTASFTSGAISGINTQFTKQLVNGCFVRPVGTSTWRRVLNITNANTANLTTTYTNATVQGIEIFLPNIQLFLDGVLQDPSVFTAVLGKDRVIALNIAPAIGVVVTVTYTTGFNTLNTIRGLAKGVGGELDGELLAFLLTTTSSVEFVGSPEFDLSMLGRANSLIFNNNVSINNTVGSMNSGNRVTVAADFFYTKFRRL